MEARSPRPSNSRRRTDPGIYRTVRQARAEAFAWMVQHAEEIGANAVIAICTMRDLGNNMTEVRLRNCSNRQPE